MSKQRSPDSIFYRLGNFVDDVKSIFSPESAVKSKAIRMGYFGFEAAHETRKDAIFPWDGPAEGMNKASRATLRARARDLERNNPITNSIIMAIKNNVVSTGFNMQARSDNEIFNKRIEELWEEWTHHENCDYTQRQSLDDLLKLISRRKQVDGGILITFPIDRRRFIPLTIQLHEVDELTSENVPLENGNILSDGVECTADGLPVAYWITQTDVDGFTIAEPQRIPAENAIFLWDRTRVSQFREITPMASTIVTTKDVGDYNNAVAFQQKTAACTSAFVETSNTAGAMGRMAAMEQQKSNIEQIKGGRVQYLNPGETVKMLIPSGQAAEVGNYLPLQQRMIAAAMGLSLESTSRNVERVNYSSARQNLLADENTYKQMRKELVEYFLRPLYRRFVNICYLAGLLDGTGFKPDDLQYYKAVWLAPSLGWIDPKKEAEANSINLQNGGKSFQQYCAEQGVDWRERIDEMAEVQEYAESKGVTLSFNVADNSDGNKQGDDETDGEN